MLLTVMAAGYQGVLVDHKLETQCNQSLSSPVSESYSLQNPDSWWYQLIWLMLSYLVFSLPQSEGWPQCGWSFSIPLCPMLSSKCLLSHTSPASDVVQPVLLSSASCSFAIQCSFEQHAFQSVCLSVCLSVSLSECLVSLLGMCTNERIFSNLHNIS